ncbi:PREDICTED: uncharacterized protein LOC109179738 isoform X2 [Ipomoea nil]|uniref:uncharacterized protein LOC109179738 isoform X2 n=1 Tax=Ipomoea nil TaxID=35883 RepID=UPI000900A06F|nr:PREDICTED: uncharacterized protein LOC109179738 isoform X2 [Ipomoea nil]
MSGSKIRAKRRRGTMNRSESRVKKQRVGQEPQQPVETRNDDDDFVTPPTRLNPRLEPDILRNEPEYELNEEEQTKYPSMITRVTGKPLVDALNALNARQRQAVTSIGFQQILHLKIIETPKRLGNWLLQNFDASTRTLRLEDNKTITIGEDEVEAVFGLPRGGVEVTNRKPNELTKTLLEWRGFYLTARHNITPAKVSSMLDEFPEGCDWFKRHFTVLLVSTIIRSMQNGYCHQLFIDDLDDVTQISNLNWCKYLLINLVETHEKWMTKKHKRFSGPLLFLTVLYMDRVKFVGNAVPRQRPAIKGWTCRHMRDREFKEIRLGGFGHGELLPADLEGEERVDDDPPEDAANSHQISGGEKVMMDLKKTVEDIEHLIKEADDVTVKEEIFRQFQDRTQTLTKMQGSHGTAEVNLTPPTEPGDTQCSDEIWNNPNTIQWVQEVERDVQQQIEKS